LDLLVLLALSTLSTLSTLSGQTIILLLCPPGHSRGPPVNGTGDKEINAIYRPLHKLAAGSWHHGEAAAALRGLPWRWLVF